MKLDIDNKTNPIKPFWSWNDNLQKDMLVSQIDDMNRAGIGGYFMHARGGLITEYMSDEWFEDIEVCLDKAKETGMQTWAYDENGWPSGFANGVVPKLGEEYQQKHMLLAKYGEKQPQKIIAYYKQESEGFVRIKEPKDGCLVIGYNINLYYIDTFNPKAIKAFIAATHEKYYEKFSSRFGTDLKGFFIDEPQYGNGFRIPWSQVMPEAFKEAYGYNLIDILPYLFFDLDNYKAYRADFYNFVSMQFRTSFIKQMYDWCTEHNCMLTGHMMNEDNLALQMSSTAGVMSCYEYFHEPGIDWLGRSVSNPLTPKQLGSVAAQLGRKTLTESFALCGWDVSLNELKWIAQWQFVNGVTSLCPHLEGYSLKGCRKRDYPASLFTQLPWFKDIYPIFSKYFTTLGALLDSGKEDAQVLVLHMLQSAYTAYNPCEMSELYKKSGSFERTASELSDYHIPHHYGDEIIMGLHGSIKDNELVIGKCRYNTVFLPEITNITANTLRLLSEFAAASGKIAYMGEFPVTVDGRENAELKKLAAVAVSEADVAGLRECLKDELFVSIMADGKESYGIYAMHRYFDDGRELLYVVNLRNEKHCCDISINGEYSVYEYPVIDEELTLIASQINKSKTVFKAELAPYGSFVYILDKNIEISPAVKGEIDTIKLENRFDIEHCDDNALTLDYCEYRVDDGEWQEKCPIIDVQRRLIELKKNCKIELRIKFIVDDIGFSKLNFCVEAPEAYEFAVNGQKIEFKDEGCFIDHIIRSTSIKDNVKMGENTITLKGEFHQNENVYKVLFTPGMHEVEKNKLTYDTELESLYIIGDFGVTMSGNYRYGERRGIHGGRKFILTAAPKTVDISKITESGFWFFSGKIDLSQEIIINKRTATKYRIALSKLNAPAARLFVNDKYVGALVFAPYEIDVTDYLADGKNKITVQMLSGNRNLLGPHHRPYGECYSVCPDTFTDQLSWCDSPGADPWTDDYSFVLFGAEI